MMHNQLSIHLNSGTPVVTRKEHDETHLWLEVSATGKCMPEASLVIHGTNENIAAFAHSLLAAVSAVTA